MSSRGWFVVAALVGCGGGTSRPVNDITIHTPPAKPLPPPACITPPEAEAVVTHATGDGTTAKFCIGDASDQCFKLDLTLGTLQRLAEAPLTDVPTAHVETTNPKVEICTAGDCKALTPKVLPGTAPLHATTNADGSILVVLLGDAEAGRGYAEIWDVAKSKRTASFKYARGDFRCGEVKMLGDTILVAASTCTAPAARGALYSLKGKKIADVGGKDFGAFGSAAAHLDGSTWAFLEENANLVVVQDVARGKILKKLDVSPLWSADGMVNKDAMGNPGESAIISLGNNRVAVIAGAPASGRVATLDLATGEVAVTRAPLCK